MEQHMAQFTGEEPAQIREHNRVAELEREVERLRAISNEWANWRRSMYKVLDDTTNTWRTEKQRAEELERTLAWYANAERYKTVHGENAILADAGQRARKALNSE